MKLRRVASLCKKSGAIHLLTRNNKEQWLGNQTALYPAYQLPFLEEEHIYRIFDYSEKQREECAFSDLAEQDTSFRLQDALAEEVLLEPLLIEIQWNGQTLRAFSGKETIYYLDSDYLSPLTAPDSDRTYYLRPGGYIAVKSGLLLSAVILPVWPTKRMADELTRLAESTAEVEEQTLALVLHE